MADTQPTTSSSSKAVRTGPKPGSEITLGQAAEDEQYRTKMLTFGVIVDTSEPFRLDGKDDFICKVKVIDDTFNFKVQIKNKEVKFHKYVVITMYSKAIDGCPKVKSVGEIIRLRRFEICLSEKGELTAFQNKFANWVIYTGDPNTSISQTSSMAIEKNTHRMITSQESERIRQLQQWSYGFMAANTLRNVIWWSALFDPKDETSAINSNHIAEEVDLILMAVEVDKQKKMIKFNDQGNSRYLLYLDQTPALTMGTCVKLRCVNVIFMQEGRVIQLRPKSSCLVMPAQFYDVRQFPNQPNLSVTEVEPTSTKQVNQEQTPLISDVANQKLKELGRFVVIFRKQISMVK